MYQAIPYSSARPCLMPAADVVMKAEPKVVTVASRAADDEDYSRPAEPAQVDFDVALAEVERAVAESPVLVVGQRGCCLSHVVKRLLQGLGVNPAVHEVTDEAWLAGVVPAAEALPAVFVGGKLLGGLDRLMAVHISGELVPILKKAGALWL
jgi:glutaredoxin-like protein